MPFIPHTDAERRAMLDAIGADSVDALYDEIPAALRHPLTGCAAEFAGALTEAEITRLMTRRAALDQSALPLSFRGAGAYEHHIPAAIWQIATRGEFYSAYTPYQAEASQGGLQVMYEFQSMLAALTGMDTANASLYDGASGLAEACLMALRCHKRGTAVAIARNLHPRYREVAVNFVTTHGGTTVELDYEPGSGQTDLAAAERALAAGAAALAIAWPNFFGALDDVDNLSRLARRHGALLIAVVNPLSLALLAPPGEWAEGGADIVVGEAQPFGIPLASGGPYLGFMSCRAKWLRQMPGRIAGRSVDADGTPAFTLTLQAREQHIRRAKATSNICTNQGLLVTAATQYLALLGPAGLRDVALACHGNARHLYSAVLEAGARPAFSAPFFHEFVFRPANPTAFARAARSAGIDPGFPLGVDYPELVDHLLVCCTETKTAGDLLRFAECLRA